mgnify:FL=1
MTGNKYGLAKLILLAVSRVSLTLTFIVSGFAKLSDPNGMALKLEEYCNAFGLTGLLFHPLPLFFYGILLGIIEFELGILMLFGANRRATSTLIFALLAVMTPLTLYLAIDNPVANCGCFGELIPLSNWETFLKNLFLITCAAIALRWNQSMRRIVSERGQWMIRLYSVAYAIGLTAYSIVSLPPIDAMGYTPGTQIGDTDKTINFTAINLTTREDRGRELLAKGYTLLLTSDNIAEANDGEVDRINLLTTYAQRNGMKFIMLTASEDDKAITQWREMTGAEYPILWCDETEIRTMVRSNPGLMLVKDGRLVRKWSNYNIPTLPVEDLDLPPQRQQWTKPDTTSVPTTILKLILWFFIPLSLWTILDNIYISFKKHKILSTHNKKHKTTMRKKIVAGNWKMNMNLQEGVALATELKGALAADAPACDVVICTPFIHLATVAGIIDGTAIGLGAENCADKAKGAYTGEVSAEMVKSTGAQYVILGHSERRSYYGETAEILKEKVNLALANGLKVIFCIGEVKEEREAGKQNEVVAAQLEGSLYDLTAEQFANIILAYEPVWAIGTGLTATSDQAEDMHAFIRGEISKKFGAEAAENVSILYGGSCKPSNAKEIFSKPDVDGGLIGGAALKVADFKGIIDAWK